MNETFSDGDGRVTERLVAYFAARVQGGTALLVTGAVATRLASQFVWGRNLSCYAEGHLQGLSLLTDRVHYFGGLIAAQMSTVRAPGALLRSFPRVTAPRPEEAAP